MNYQLKVGEDSPTRNTMVNNPSTFSSSKKELNCICNEHESMKHPYNLCKMLNISENTTLKNIFRRIQ